jgi:hypothetical protein
VNVSQLKMMLEQMDDQAALNRRWTHKLYHVAEGAEYARTAEVLRGIQGLLDEVRAQLSDAQDALDKDSVEASNVVVSLV